MNIRISYLICTAKLDNLFFMFEKSSKGLKFKKVICTVYCE